MNKRDVKGSQSISSVLPSNPLRSGKRSSLLVFALALIQLAFSVGCSLSSQVAAKFVEAIKEPAPEPAKFKVSLDRTSVSLSEGSVLMMSVLLSEPRTEPTMVNVELSSPGNDVADHFAAVPAHVTIPAGQLAAPLTITALNDHIYRPNNTFSLTISTSETNLEVNPSEMTIQWSDNDAAPKVRFSTASQLINENAGSGQVQVDLSIAASVPVTVDYAFEDGTAIKPAAYSGTSGTLTFAPGETTKTLPFTVVDIAHAQGNKAFAIALNSPSGDASLDTPSSHAVDIVDLQTVSVSIASASPVIEAGTATFNVALSVASSSTVTVAYTTSSGTASSGTDFTAATGTLSFAPGETLKTISIPSISDTLHEDTEGFSVTLSSPTNATLGSATGSGVINDDDPEPNISIAAVAVSEGTGAGSGTATFTATLSAASSLPVTVNYATANGTAIAGADYTSASGSISFNAGETSKTITVSITRDSLHEGNETFAVALSGGSGYTSAGSTLSATGTINDDDAPPALNFASTSGSAIEGGGNVVVQVQLSAVSGLDVTVPFSVTGTATIGSDATITASPLSIPAGSTTASITLSVTDDASPESDETVILTLGSPTNATLGASKSYTQTLLNDDLGAFSIGGIIGPGDATADAYLNAGIEPIVSWAASSGATSYAVTIYENDGVTTKCAEQSTTATSYSFSGCALSYLTTYKAKVVATGGVASATASNNMFAFRVNRAAVSNGDGPFYVLKSGSITVSPLANDSDADGDILTIVSVTQGSNGNVSYTASDVTYSPTTNFTGTDSFTYTMSDGNGSTSTATVSVKVVTSHTWTGNTGSSGSGSWFTAGNWCGSINASKTGCTGTGTVPGASDTAIFDATCSNHCSANIDTGNAAVAGLVMGASYGGTITQGTGRTLTVGTGGFTQASGMFKGGNSATTFNGVLTMTGGTFMPTTGTTTVANNLSIDSVASFSAIAGKFSVTPNASGVTVYAPSATFFDFELSQGYGRSITLNSNLTINGSHTRAGYGSECYSTSYKFLVAKDVITSTSGTPYTLGTCQLKLVGSSNRTVSSTHSNGALPTIEVATDSTAVTTFSGTLILKGGLTHSTGTVLTTGSTIHIMLTGISSTISTPGGMVFDNMKLELAYNTVVTLGNDATVNGSLALLGYGGAINGYKISVGSNLSMSSSYMFFGTTVIRLVGAADRTITGTAGGFNSLEIATSSTATTTISGNPRIGNLTYVSGLVSHPAPSVLTLGETSGNWTLDLSASGLSLGNVKLFRAWAQSGSITGILTVNGDLTIAGAFGGSNQLAGSGRIDLHGNLQFTAQYPMTATAEIRMVGTGVQSMSGSGSSLNGPLVIAKPSGSVELTTNVALYSPTSTVTMTSGTLNMNGKNLSLGSLVMSPGTVINQGGGVLTRASYNNGGTINP